ncbi:AarF/ABC1/UbiB kinase family protein [Nocardia uniformis]|uniref:AarF/ABC1/UbiB kinase family protein n=1 Tax=Nocardia uniformis TaxID=53432 RepID=A0A849C7T0_9NOCA|nr:AarF/ABC1/UbiB kinase family protein [Nocardia uniformis]NNH70939.1 AarF/ABC1/UbiB kinase family protein [Nocardia uniformis]
MAEHSSGEGWGRVLPFARREAQRAEGAPPTRKLVRDAKLAALPVAYAGRQAAGVGWRLFGRPATEVEAEIHMRTAEHVFEVLGELKGSVAKLGQILSVYQDAMPIDLAEAYGLALSKLQNAVPAMSPALVAQVLAENFGPGWRELFREFETHPAAAATIGQVHRAVWHDGRPVAVKVMYPGAREAVRADFTQLRLLGVVLGALLPGAEMGPIIEMICACVTDELDYGQEAHAQRGFAAGFAGDPDFAVPDVVAQATDVLVSEWLEGAPLSELISSGTQEERNRIGLLVLRFAKSAHVRTGGLLYTDLHPGNFLVLPDGRLGVVDFGACSPWPDTLEPAIADIGAALYESGDLEAALRRHGLVRPGREFDAAALMEIAKPILPILWDSQFRLSPEWLRDRVEAVTEIRLTNVFRQMTLPPEFIPVARAVITGIGVLCQLRTEGPIGPEFLAWTPALAEVAARRR